VGHLNSRSQFFLSPTKNKGTRIRLIQKRITNYEFYNSVVILSRGSAWPIIWKIITNDCYE